MDDITTKGTISGLSCLAAIARFHGLDLADGQIAHLAGSKTGKLEPSQLVQTAVKIGLTAKQMNVSWDRLGRLGPVWPAILILRDNEAVILSGLRDANGVAEIVVRDPSAPGAGFQFWGRQKTEEQWSGQLILLKRQFALTDTNQPFSLRWFIPEFARQKRALFDVITAAMTMNVLALASPIFLQLVIDRVVVHRVMATMVTLSVGVLIAIAFDTALTYVRSYILLYMASKIDMRLTSRIFSKLLSLPLDFFERNLAGVLTKHVQQDQKIRDFLSGRLLLTLLDASVLFVFIPVLLFYSVILAIVVIICALMLAGVIAALTGPYRRRLTELYRAEADRQAMLVEAIHGISTVKSLGLEPSQSNFWDERAANVIQSRISVGRISAVARTISSGLEKLMLVVVVIIGVFLIFNGHLTVGSLVAFQILASRVTGPLVQLSGLINEFQDVTLSVRMLGNVMNANSEPGMRRGLRPQIDGGVSFDNVTFSYANSPTPALQAVSFSIQAGQVVGVVGRSGSGKSTLVRLVQGLYPVQRGLVRIDGHEIRELDKVHLRRHVGVVLQENFLFRGTVRDNIGAGMTGASFEGIVWAARQAGAEEFIERLPEGYDTTLEEGGANLSGGQKQRLAIARALLRRPRILIFDEATSALDPETEVIIQDNLGRIVEGKTTIIVSHRLSSLRNCDKIIVLEDGKIVGIDRHEQLLSTCSPYRQLWDKQSRSFQ